MPSSKSSPDLPTLRSSGLNSPQSSQQSRCSARYAGVHKATASQKCLGNRTLHAELPCAFRFKKIFFGTTGCGNVALQRFALRHRFVAVPARELWWWHSKSIHAILTTVCWHAFEDDPQEDGGHEGNKTQAERCRFWFRWHANSHSATRVWKLFCSFMWFLHCHSWLTNCPNIVQCSQIRLHCLHKEKPRYKI